MDKPFGVFRQPKNTLPRIQSVYLFVSVDREDGNEGVCAVEISGTLMPLIAADEQRLAILRPVAAEIARISGMEIRLIRLTERADLETFGPSPQVQP